MGTEENSDISISREFNGADFGDIRLRKRLKKIASSMAREPAVGLPGASGSDSALEATYRFLGNERVSPEKILAPHFRATSKRVVAERDVIIIHDTSIFCFTGEAERTGLCEITKEKQGFYGHLAFAVSATREASPLGALSFQSFTRTRDKGRRPSSDIVDDPSRESLRWLHGVDQVEQRVGKRADLIHVMDRQADFYELLSRLVSQDCRFAIRISHDRRLFDDQSEGTLFSKLDKAEGVFSREVPLSRRKKSKMLGTRKSNPPRGYRIANLTFSACSVEVKAPNHLRERCLQHLELNVVHVREYNPPLGEEPVDWKIATTDRIDSEENIAKIVDTYRKRWLIEEYFKSLKTGCAYEQRQLESINTLLNVLAVTIPIAWRLLLLRSLSRTEPNSHGVNALTQTQIDVLRSFSNRKLPKQPTTQDLMLAVAALGGHIKNNGNPGWLVLWRGFKKLLDYEQGWLAAITKKRCDQS